jgi:predicted nucleotidyltransferase component of viral defense system
MLTKQQLQRIAQHRAIGLHALERDYVQYLVLSIVYTRGQSFVFKGGTALRVVHHSPRYSEDLHFNTAVDLDTTKRELREVVAGLGRYGIRLLCYPARSFGRPPEACLRRKYRRRGYRTQPPR